VVRPDFQLIDLQTGQDTRGWVTFEIPDGATPTNLVFDHILRDAPATIPLR
jgi:hypothetical protein